MNNTHLMFLLFIIAMIALLCIVSTIRGSDSSSSTFFILDPNGVHIFEVNLSNPREYTITVKDVITDTQVSLKVDELVEMIKWFKSYRYTVPGEGI
jgi:hypothetical protein